MCLSFFGQILYGAVMIAALALTATSMFSPGWREFTDAAGNDVGHSGIFNFFCTSPGGTATPPPGDTTSGNLDYCSQWWQHLSGWEQAVIACMCLAFVAEIFAIIWTGVTLCACCCKSFVSHPLPLIATFIAVFLAVAIAIFGVRNRDALDGGWASAWKNQTPSVGYSFYLACGALGLAIADIIIGSLTLTLAKRCL